MQDRTAVAKGLDFEWSGCRYQVKANRPSGKPGSRVTLVPKPKNYDWDRLIWILYNVDYEIELPLRVEDLQIAAPRVPDCAVQRGAVAAQVLE